MLSRIGGKLCFATLRDGSGDIQVVLSGLDRSSARSRSLSGRLSSTWATTSASRARSSPRRGELSVLADAWAITAKSLRPLPEKHKGLGTEQRVRMRYVDLIVNPDARRMLKVRSTAVRAVRDSLVARDYLEVETPMLQVVHGGANARPFRTHINAYNMELYLRIAPELFLKRLAVGGIERVFEINRNFRNEGVDASHNPEFTMLEAYQAYGDYDQMQTLTRELIQEAAVAAFGSPVVTHVDGSEHDLGGMWRSVTVYGGLSEKLGVEISADTATDELRRLCAQSEIPLDPGVGPWSDRPGDVRAPARGPHRRADVLPRLPDRRQPAHPAAQERSPAGRALGPRINRLRQGDRHRLLRVGRSGRAAAPAHRTVLVGRGW